jgi:hypothetical protein
MSRLTLGQLRELTKNLPDDFTIEITATLGFNPFPDMEKLVDVSVDIGHSDKVVHLFGELDGIRN